MLQIDQSNCCFLTIGASLDGYQSIHHATQQMWTLCYKMAANVDTIPQEKIALISLIPNRFRNSNRCSFFQGIQWYHYFFLTTPNFTAIGKKHPISA